MEDTVCILAIGCKLSQVFERVISPKTITKYDPDNGQPIEKTDNAYTYFHNDEVMYSYNESMTNVTRHGRLLRLSYIEFEHIVVNKMGEQEPIFFYEIENTGNWMQSIPLEDIESCKQRFIEVLTKEGFKLEGDPQLFMWQYES